MSTVENKALAQRFFENGFQEIMRGNVDVAHEYFADNYRDHTSMAGPPWGAGAERDHR